MQIAKGIGDNEIWRIAKLNGILYLPGVGSKTTSFSSEFCLSRTRGIVAAKAFFRKRTLPFLFPRGTSTRPTASFRFPSPSLLLHPSPSLDTVIYPNSVSKKTGSASRMIETEGHQLNRSGKGKYKCLFLGLNLFSDDSDAE